MEEGMENKITQVIEKVLKAKAGPQNPWHRHPITLLVATLIVTTLGGGMATSMLNFYETQKSKRSEVLASQYDNRKLTAKALLREINTYSVSLNHMVSVAYPPIDSNVNDRLLFETAQDELRKQRSIWKHAYSELYADVLFNFPTDQELHATVRHVEDQFKGPINRGARVLLKLQYEDALKPDQADRIEEAAVHVMTGVRGFDTTMINLSEKMALYTLKEQPYTQSFWGYLFNTSE